MTFKAVQAPCSHARSPIGVATGYFLVSAVFGVMAVQSGLAWWFAPLLCLTVYAGASQFAALSLMLGGASLPVIVSAAFLINARHVLMVAYMADRVKNCRWSRTAKTIYAASLTDESFAFHSKYYDRDLYRPRQLISFNLTCYGAWIAGSFLGANITHLVDNINDLDVDFALTAMLVYVLVSISDTRPKVIGGVATALTYYMLSTVAPSSNLNMFIAAIAGCLIAKCTAQPN